MRIIVDLISASLIFLPLPLTTEALRFLRSPLYGMSHCFLVIVETTHALFSTKRPISMEQIITCCLFPVQSGFIHVMPQSSR